MKHTVAGITLDTSSKVLQGPDGQVLKMRRQSYEVFNYLVQNANRVVSRSEILEAVWPDVVVTEDSIAKCIGEIRKLLGDQGRDILQTVPKRGFYLCMEETETEQEIVIEQSITSRNFPQFILPIVLLIALLISFAAFRFDLFQFDEPLIGKTTIDKPTLAVLAFDNFSDDPALDYFGDGFSEDIISTFARFPDLSVVARNSSFAYKETQLDIQSIGRELGATYVLAGSVQKQADKLRLTAQLVDAENEEHVWAERYEGEDTDPWALKDEVISRIVSSLTGEDGHLKIAEYQRTWGKDSGSLEEYDYYLRGHELFMKNTTKELLNQAGKIWKQGLQDFPDSTLLRAKLSFYHLWLVWQYWSDDRAASLDRAEQLAQEALSLPGSSPHTRRSGHWAMALTQSLKGNLEHAAMEAKTAIAMSPYDGHMVGDLAGIIAMAGKPQEAILLLEDLKSRDPNFSFYFNLAIAYYLNGDDEKTIETALQYRATSLNRYVLLASSYVRLGDMEEARSAIRTLLEMKPTFTQEDLKNTYLYADPSILPRQSADLGRAGLPKI